MNIQTWHTRIVAFNAGVPCFSCSKEFGFLDFCGRILRRYLDASTLSSGCFSLLSGYFGLSAGAVRDYAPFDCRFINGLRAHKKF
jgi:hypothetical protein